MIIAIWIIFAVIVLFFNYAAHANNMEHDKMTRNQYCSKLLGFNCTDKYRAELRFMGRLVSPNTGGVIVDYGCGIGTAVRWFNNEYECVTHGYDVVDYWDGERSRYLFDKLIVCDKVYFMHSIAHMGDVSRVITKLKRLGVKEIHVITPNNEWLSMQRDRKYKPDDSVVKHFSPDTLAALFSEHKITQQGQFGECKNGKHERLFISVTLLND